MYKLTFAVVACLVISHANCEPKYTLDDKPPEHENEFYEKKSIPDIKQTMADNLEYIRPIFEQTVEQYKKNGLTVAALFYEDARAWVESSWPRIICALDEVSTEKNKTTYAMFAKEMYGWHHLVDRVRENRQKDPLIPAKEDDKTLLTQITEQEKKVIGALDTVIGMAKKGNNPPSNGMDHTFMNGNRFLEKFHTYLKNWLEPEFAKLNKAAEALPDAQQRANNLKILLADFTPLLVPPF